MIGSGKPLRPLFHLEVTGFGDGCFVTDLQAGGLPGVEAPIKQMHVIMPKEFQEPEQPGRTHSGDVVISNDRAVAVDAFRLNQVLDDTQERIQRLRSRIDETDSKDVKASSAGNVTV